MALRKLERSCRTPPGRRLATVEEAKENLDSIRRDNLLEEWDRVRLLDGWIGGSGYDFNVQVGFRSCLGYMLVIESPTPEIFNTADRNAALYSKVPELSNEGRSAALLLCCEDWNKDVLYWLMAGETEEDRAREDSIWEGNEIEAASELVNAIARELQSVLAKTRVAGTESSLGSWEVSRISIEKFLEALAVDTKNSLKALMIKNQNSEQGKIANDVLEELFSSFPENDNKYYEDIGVTDDLKMFQDSGFDTSLPSTWEVVANTVRYFTVEILACASTYALSFRLYNQVVEERKMMDDCPTLASLINYSNRFIEKTFDGTSGVVEAAAKEANGDLKRFAEILSNQWFSLLSNKDKSDALSIFLVRAAKKGDVNLVKRLIENGVQLSETYYKGKTALHYAAKLDDESDGLKIVRMLLKESLANELDIEECTLPAVASRVYASVTSKDEDGQTPLHYAFLHRQQNEEFVRVLISAVREGIVEGSARLVDIKDNDGETPLDLAIEENTNVNMVAWLLSQSSEPQSYFENLDLSLYLRECSRMGYNGLVEMMLREGADPFEPDDEAKTSLHYAAEGENEDAALGIIRSLLLDRKQGTVNVEKASAGDKYGRNVLHVAAFLGHDYLCRWLLRGNRNIDTKDRDGQSAIYYAVAGPHDDTDVLSEIISGKQATKQVFVKDFSQTTPLHVAAARGNRNMVEKLLSEISRQERKNYVEATDVLGQTALHKAASGGHKEVVEMLLTKGAHPLKERDCDGKTALHFAAQANGENAVKIAELLLDKCESDKQKSLLLFASAVGIGLRSNSSLEEYLEQERRKILEKLGAENLLRVAATLGDIDMTREFITRGANISLIRNEKWMEPLPEGEKKNVQDVLNQIKNIVEQGADEPALRDNLGRSPFANGLAALFLNPFVKSPITVGISGEWGMGKSSVMVQTESILLKTAAQLAFTNSFQENNIPGAGESKLSVTGEARRRKIANAIERLEAERRDGPNIIKRVKNFTAKATDPQNCSRLCKFWNALWEESAPPEDLRKFNTFLRNYDLKYHQIFKSLAVMDRRDMFEEGEENRSGNQSVGEMPWQEGSVQGEEDSMQGTTPSILTVRYNAWHYRNETEAWAGLAVEITKELEATMTVAHKLRTSWIYNWRNRRNSICFGVILPCFLALVVAIWFTTIVWLLLDTAQHEDIKKFKYGGLPASMIIAAWGVGKSVISFVKPISSQVVDYICLPDHSQKLGYHQKVSSDINFLKGELRYRPSRMWNVFAFIWCCITFSWDENYIPGTTIPKMPPAFKNNLRIIVFVDDLDRCEENVILKVLSAVNLVLATCQINVILSMEKSMIQRAIIRKYGNYNRKSNKSNEDLADKYLRKIVQLPLHLPDPSHSESIDFLQSQLGMWDSKKGSTDPTAKTEKDNTYGRRRVNPKFQLGPSIPKKPKLGRRETKKYFAESRAKPQRAASFSDPARQRLGKTEQQETIEKPEGSGVEESETKINILDTAGIAQPIKTDEQGKNEQMAGDQEQREDRKSESSLMDLSSITSAMLIPKYSRGERNAFHFLHTRSTRSRKLPREWKCLMAYHRLAWNILSLTPDVIPVEGWQVQLIAWIFVCWEWRHLMTTLIQNWNNLGVLRKWKIMGENSGPSLREIVEHYIDEKWPADKKSDNFHGDSATKREDDAIDSLNEDSATKKKDDAIDSLTEDSASNGKDDAIDNLNEDSATKKEDEAIDSVNEDSATKKEDDAVDNLNEDVDENSSSSTEKMGKASGNLPEENITISSEDDTEGDGYLNEVLRKVLKEQEEMREILRKVFKEQEEMREILRKVFKEQEEMGEVQRKALKEQEEVRDTLKMIKRKVVKEEENNKGESSLQQGTTVMENQKVIIKKMFIADEDDEGESSLQQYTTAEENQKSEKAKDEEERQEWSKLRETLQRYNVSMDGIQAFQKFRFYCEPGYLPWPLPEQT